MTNPTYEELAQKVKELQAEVARHEMFEEALGKSEHQLRLLTDNSPAFISYVGIDDLRYKFVNKKFAEAFNTPREKIIGKHIKDIIGDSNFAFAFKHIEQVKSGIEVSYENVFHLAQGKRWIQVNYVPDLDIQGKVVGIVVLSYDITERKQAEENLKESERRYRHLYTNTPVMLHSIDRDKRLVEVSDTWLEKLGYQKEEVIGRKLLDFLTEESARYASEEVLPEFFTKGYCKDINYQFVKKNGEVLDILLSAMTERNEEGEIIRSLAVLLDITEKRQLENQLRQAQKMEAIGTLAGGIAHDFNNLLTVIIGNTGLALDDLPENSQAKTSLDSVLIAADRAKDLVGQILAFGRKAGQAPQPIQPHVIIKEAAKLLRSTIPSSIEIRQKIDPESGTIIADPTQIHQVLMNLSTNAVHAMQEKGVLEIRLKQTKLDSDDLTHRPDMVPGPYVRLSVSDTGTGMDQETVNRIFDPFFTTKGVGEGTGMGLSVVYGIVMTYHGMITVDSKPGKRTTFHVYFPITGAEELQLEEPDKTLPTGNERILLIDDEEVLARMWDRSLKRLGYQVTTKTSSIGALKIFSSQPDEFDLVITDQTMPGITGAELAQELLKIRADIPIILCTGYSSKITSEKASELGIREFMMKPLDRMQLSKAIRVILNERKKDSSRLSA